MPAYIEPRIRLDKFTDKSGGPNACWPWMGCKSRKGYGGLSVVLSGGAKVSGAHRVAWSLEHGIPPAGMVVDHMCENPGCVNPAHLRVTDNRTNVMIGRGACANHARKTHCIRGHRLSGDNLIIHKRGFRQCKVCLRSSQLRWHMRANHGWSGEQMLVLESIAANLWFKAA